MRVADAEKWDEPDVRRDYRKTVSGSFLFGMGFFGLLSGLFLVLVVIRWPEFAVDIGIWWGIGQFAVGCILLYFGNREKGMARSVKVSGTWATKGGWRKRRL